MEPIRITLMNGQQVSVVSKTMAPSSRIEKKHEVSLKKCVAGRGDVPSFVSEGEIDHINGIPDLGWFHETYGKPKRYSILFIKN